MSLEHGLKENGEKGEMQPYHELKDKQAIVKQLEAMGYSKEAIEEILKWYPK